MKTPFEVFSLVIFLSASATATKTPFVPATDVPCPEVVGIFMKGVAIDSHLTSAELDRLRKKRAAEMIAAQKRCNQAARNEMDAVLGEALKRQEHLRGDCEKRYTFVEGHIDDPRCLGIAPDGAHLRLMYDVCSSVKPWEVNPEFCEELLPLEMVETRNRLRKLFRQLVPKAVRELFR